MPKRKEPLHKETVTEKAIRLMGQRVTIQYYERGELCAIFGTPTKIEPEDKTKDKTRSLVVWEPFSSRVWYVPISIITEIEAGG
jgi:hypothetical protein